MTIYNTTNTTKPCRIYDANGEEILFVISCDTETGEVIHLVHDGTSFVLDETGRNIKRFKSMRPIPLRIEWLDKDTRLT